MKQRQLAIINLTGQGEIIEEATPTPGQGEVLVNFKASMISPGTQLTGIREIRSKQAPPRTEPRRMGYQAAGVVAAIGSDIHHLKVGDRVACFGSGALHTNYGVVAQNLCSLLPDEVSFEEASCMNLVLTAIQAYRRAAPNFGEFMLIVGLGVVGQLTGQIARAAGQYVMGWDTLPGRLAIAKQSAADEVLDPRNADTKERCAQFTGNLGFDNAVMAIGGNGDAALKQVTHVMKVTPDGHAMGSLIMVGGLSITSAWGATLGNLDVRSSARTGPGYHDTAWEHGQTAYPNVYVRWSTQTNMQLALRMIADKRISVNHIITHKMPLGDFPKAVDLLLNEPDTTQSVVLMMED